MASITAISRCAGETHVNITVQRTAGGTFQRTFEMPDLIAAPPLADERYQEERIKLMIREAQAAGNTTYAQIRTYLLNRAFVE